MSLTVTVPASDLQTAQDVDVSVTNPAAVTGYTDGGTSSSIAFHIDQPPAITSLVLNPMQSSANSVSLTVNGSGFCDSSKPWCQSTVTWVDGASATSTMTISSVGGKTGTPGSLNAQTDNGGGTMAAAQHASPPVNPTFPAPEDGTYFDV